MRTEGAGQLLARGSAASLAGMPVATPVGGRPSQFGLLRAAAARSGQVTVRRSASSERAPPAALLVLLPLAVSTPPRDSSASLYSLAFQVQAYSLPTPALNFNPVPRRTLDAPFPPGPRHRPHPSAIARARASSSSSAMFSRKKDRDRRSSSVVSPPPLPAHGQRQPSQTSSIDGRPLLQGPRRSSTSVELSADADGTAGGSSSKRGRRGSFFGFGASAKGHDGAEQPAQHGSGFGGLLNRTTSRFSTHDAAAGGEVDDPQAVEAGRREAAQRLASNGTSRSSPLANANGSASSQQLPSPAPTPPAAAGPAPPGTGIDAQRSAAAAEGLRHAIHLLAAAQPDKVYRTSPPTVRSLQMYGLDGKHPKVGVPGSETNDWRETWLELRGVVLRACSPSAWPPCN